MAFNLIAPAGAGAPQNYDYMNAADSSISPSSVHSQNTFSVAYYRRYYLQRALSVFDFTLPETWNKAYFLYVLFTWGHLAVINTDKFGVIPQGCTLRGYGVFYQPTNAIITNPLLTGIIEPRIDKECTLIQLSPDYGGIMDLVNDFAEMRALTSELISVNLVNSKLSYVFTAANKTAAESLKKLYDKITAGEPAVVQDTKLLNADGSPAWQAFAQDLRSNFIAGDGLEIARKIDCMYDNEIGIPANLATAKKERTISAEVEANDTETMSKVSLWLEYLQTGLEKTRKMFDIPEAQLNVKLRFGGESIESEPKHTRAYTARPDNFERADSTGND